MAPAPDSVLARLERAFGPLVGGILLDLVDLATFGPVGLAAGWLVGGIVGWWVSSIHGFGPWGRLVFAAAAALYVALPFTAIVPLATIVSATARFQREGRGSAPPPDDTVRDAEVVRITGGEDGGGREPAAGARATPSPRAEAAEHRSQNGP